MYSKLDFFLPGIRYQSHLWMSRQTRLSARSPEIQSYANFRRVQQTLAFRQALANIFLSRPSVNFPSFVEIQPHPTRSNALANTKRSWYDSRIGPAHFVSEFVSSSRPQRGKENTLDTFEREINKALRSLKSQETYVSPAIVGPDGFVHDVMGFMLTHLQILYLHREGRLNPSGIREFAEVFEKQFQRSSE